MLPCTNRGRRPAPPNSGPAGTSASTDTQQHAAKPLPPSPQRSGVGSQHRNNVSPGSKVPRTFHHHSCNRRTKKTSKEDLSSIALFSDLNVEPPPPEGDQRSTNSLPAPLDSLSALEENTRSPPEIEVDDPIWIECKDTIDTLEGELNRTFLPRATSPFIFGDDVRAADKAFHDAKATIRRAAKRLTYHWDREHQLNKLGPMLQAQIVLGQRIREAWAGAMARKERILDQITEEQVELGSEEMGMLLDGLSSEWFESDWDDVDRV